MLNLVTSLETDFSRYSSSSTVPFLPEPTLRSSFLFERELRLCNFVRCQTVIVRLRYSQAEPDGRITHLEDVFETAEGATVYRVNMVGAIEISVITSTLCRSVSSTPKNASAAIMDARDELMIVQG